MSAPNPAHMRTALDAGRRFRGATWPNPSVGCAIINPDTGDIIATGATRPGGRPHAEIDALAQAGANAKGAHAYITLEPCNHTHADKPVSCTQGLIDAGIAAAFIGMQDPDARMAGQSIAQLRAHGIDVALCDVGACIDAHIGHATRIIHGRPHITLKMAHTSDGYITHPGRRINISSPESWQKVYGERARADAVMIGITTALIDNPQLTDRRDTKPERMQGDTPIQPIRIVVDTLAQLPVNSKMVQTVAEAPVWILCARHAQTSALRDAGVRVIHCPANGDYIDMPAAMQILGELGLTSILAEGGAALANTLLKNDLVDSAIIIEGTETIGLNGLPMPAIPLHLTHAESVGPDTWRHYESEALATLKASLAKTE